MRLDLISSIVLTCVCGCLFLTSVDTCAYPTWTGASYWNQQYQMKYLESPQFYGFWSNLCERDGSHSVVGSGYRRYYREHYGSSLYGGLLCQGCVCDPSERTVKCNESTANSVLVSRASFMDITLGDGYFNPTVTHITLYKVPLQGFDTSPFQRLETLTSLVIHDTQLGEFPDLQNNTQLTYLDLSRNQISFFPHNTNPHLPLSLTHVNLVENKISWIPRDLFSGTNVTYLALSANEIGPVVTTRVFVNMPQLEYIGLDGNLITQVSKSDMDFGGSPLRTLNLSNNQISILQSHAFDNARELGILDLHRNKISDFGVCLFRNLSQLLFLDLSNNLMTTIKQPTFAYLPMLQRIRLHNQQISVIETGSFTNLKSLEEIFISSNNLESFPYSAFECRNWTTLVSIHADHNSIATVEDIPHTFLQSRRREYCRIAEEKVKPFVNFNSLRQLRLHNNAFRMVNKSTFWNLPNLEYLTLSSNFLTTDLLDLSAEYLVSLHELVLTSNRISFIRSGYFANFTTLRILRLDQNDIYVVENDALPKNLEILYLNNNKFNFKHTNLFANMTSLRELYLHSNAIDTLPVDVFLGLPGMTILNLQSNRIPFIKLDMFRDMSNLKILYLGTNEIAYVEKGSFSHHQMSGLELQLQSNWIAQLPYPTTFRDAMQATFVKTEMIVKLQNVPVYKYGDFRNRTFSNLYLYNNEIGRIRSFEFYNLQFHRLYLSSNAISVIEEHAFRSIASGDLHLNANPLKDIRQYAFDDVRADEFYLTGISMETLLPCTFRSVSARILYMNSGSLSTLNSSIFCALSITNDLHLENNRIENITTTLFTNSSYINRLYLYSNLISFISDNAFTGTTIYDLHLHNNRLVALPTNFGTTTLRYLDLESNFIARINPGLLSEQTNLVYFSASNNQITALRSGLLDSLVSLQTLDLSNNQIERIEVGFFSTNLRSLTTLDLRNNRIHQLNAFGNLPLVHIYLQDNNLRLIDKDTFEHVADSLGTLHLSNSILNCNCPLVKTLFPVRNVLVGGECHTPRTSLESYISTVNQSFTCSGENISGFASDDRTLTVQWQRPTYLQYLHNDSSELQSVPVVEGTDCTCINQTVESEQYSQEFGMEQLDSEGGNSTYGNDSVTTDTSNATFISCGQEWNTSEACVLARIAYEVECSSSTASLTAQTSNTSVTFLSTSSAPGTYQCSVSLLFNATRSAASDFVSIVVPETETNEICPNISKWFLPISYYDFSVDHSDFGDSRLTNPTNPSYISSGKDIWLSLLDVPGSESFDFWFKEKNETNHALSAEIILETSCEGKDFSYSFLSTAYYPLDDFGFGHEGQRNCSVELHNIGFTSSINTLFVFGGQEVITIGGGDIVWLYLNTRLVFEYNNFDDTSKIRCTTVLLSTPNAAIVRVTKSYGAMENGTCRYHSNETLYINLYMQIGEIYHFDLFHVQRESCSSEFLLESTNVNFTSSHTTVIQENVTTTEAPSPSASTLSPILSLSTNDSTELTSNLSVSLPSNNTASGSSPSPETDVLFVVEEDRVVGSYLGSFGLEESNSSYLVELLGTEDEQMFSLSDKRESNLTAYSTYPVSGVQHVAHGHSYFDCSLISDRNVSIHPSPTTSLVTNQTLCHVLLQKELDYESLPSHNITIQVTNLETGETSILKIRLELTDANDNCPETSSTNITLSLVRPALSTSVPMLTLRGTDADSNLNAIITFAKSAPVFRESHQSFSIILFEVLIYDGGSPSRGTLVNVNAEISNSCLFVDSRRAYNFSIEIKPGLSDEVQLFLRLPGYYSLAYDCSRPVGFEDYRVPNRAITASSVNVSDECGSSSHAHAARLHRESSVTKYGLKIAGAWIPAVHDRNQWIQVDFGKKMQLHGISTQGSPEYDFWITHYVITYSDDGVIWNIYEPNISALFNDTDCFGLTDDVAFESWRSQLNETTDCWANENYTEFNLSSFIYGNNDASNVSTVLFDSSITAQFVRVYPQAWREGIGLRMEMFGCVEAKQLAFESLCFGCTPSYYCPGDGTRFTCGRCPDTGTIGTTDPIVGDGVYNETCGRSPTEHSYGVAHECEECPAGHFCENGSASSCPEFTFDTNCDNSSCENCLPCGPGEACVNGHKVICDAGRFSVDGRTDSCYLCPGGTFSNTTKTSICEKCPAGFYSYPGSISCQPCLDQEWSSDGYSYCQPCYKECPCRREPRPCYPGVQCINKRDSNSSWTSECFDCQRGFTGDGVNCMDIDECANDLNPCFDKQQCVNTHGGFYCEGCPEGFTGKSFFGFGLFDIEPRQQCFDIDECSLSYCDSLVRCENTEGGYMCDRCPNGYTGSGYTECVLLEPCQSPSLRCYSNATCNPVNFNNAICECSLDSSGPGEACGFDGDADGQPDLFISCGDRNACAEDNCIGLPNSGQEDTDGDRRGDACDEDDDNDFVPDDVDNCPLVSNYNETGVQMDSDNDGFGDACDTCPFLTGQFPDNDGDGLGDACDDDDDNDGVADNMDVCPFDPNVTTGPDADGDGVGDACDNCVSDDNPDQSDLDQNEVGDLCDNGFDTDGDGISDALDNCLNFPNSRQVDTNGNNIGDLCDPDIDGDGVPNGLDYCPYFANSNATNDSDCQKDYDRDGVEDVSDTCYSDPTIFHTSLIPATEVHLHSDSPLASWKLFHQGRAVTQQVVSHVPALLIGPTKYGPMKLTGSIFVNEKTTSLGCLGIVFGYQSNRQFYAVLWRNNHRNDEDLTETGLKGLQIKVIHSSTGPGSDLADALWHTENKENQGTLLYHDSNLIGWNHSTSYAIQVIHRPSLGLIRVIITHHEMLIVDSGSVYDTRYTGGRVGVLAMQQGNIIWSNLQVKCMERENKALKFDGLGDYALLPNTTQFGFVDSFTIKAWIQSAKNKSGTQPIICTVDGTTLCLFIQDNQLKAIFANDSMVLINNTLNNLFWHHITLRYSAATCVLTVFINGTSSEMSSASNVQNIDWMSNSKQLAVGWNGGLDYFEGTLDDVQIYNRSLTDAQIDDYFVRADLPLQKKQQMLTGYYDMQTDELIPTVLKDTSEFGNYGLLFGNPVLVHSISDIARHEILFNN